MPALTYVSTARAVLYQGGIPRFVDVQPDTWTLDPAAVEEATGERTEAVLVVHLGGVPCDLDAIGEIAARRGLRVIEDAAQAHGARHRGRLLGTCGDLGRFSFGTTKIVCTGEGGVVLVDDDELARRARLAMNVGETALGGRPSLHVEEFQPQTPVRYELLGWNYRMSAAQAALGIGQVRRLDHLRARRDANARRLLERLADPPGLRPQRAPAEAEPCRWNLLFEVTEEAGVTRDELARALARERVDYVVPSLEPLSAHAIFGQQERRFPVAERLCRTGLGLRVDPAPGRREVDSVAFALRRILSWRNRSGTTSRT